MDQASSAAAEAVPVSSFFVRTSNVFTSTGELFAEIASTPAQTSSWLLPYILSLVIAIIFTYTLSSNQSLRQQALEPQHQNIQKQVEAGKMSQEQADRATEMMDSSTMFLLFGIIGSAVFVSLATFGIPFILWLTARFVIKVQSTYKKMLELYGLCSLVAVLGAIVTLLMMHIFDSIYAVPGGSFFIMNNFNRDNLGHKLLASVGIFTLWETAILGLGLSKVVGKPASTGMGVTFGLWIVWVIVSSLVGIGWR